MLAKKAKSGSEGGQKSGHEGGRVAVLKGKASDSGGERGSPQHRSNDGQTPRAGVKKSNNEGKGSGDR